jgi:hypothetical protein
MLVGKTAGDLAISTSLMEAQVVDPVKREVEGILLKSGVSHRRNYYSSAVVRESTPMFTGVKMYIDHPAEKDAGKTRSIRDWGATIQEASYNPQVDGIVARIAVRSPWLWENIIYPAAQGGYLDEVGISINAAGPIRLGKVGSDSVRIVEGIKKVFSADFVSEASAGGQVTQMLESAQQQLEDELMGIENLTLDEFIELRPDLVDAILQEGVAMEQEDPEDIEIMASLLESQYLLAEEIADLREDTGIVVDEFIAGFQQMGQDLEGIMESVDYEDDYEPDHRFMESADYNQPVYGVDPEVYDHLSVLQENQAILEQENNRLREDMTIVTSQTLAIQKLQESGLPDYAQEQLLDSLIGLSSHEMDVLIDRELTYVNYIIESQGGVPITGNGGSYDEDEYAQASNDVAQQRLDKLVGVK